MQSNHVPSDKAQTSGAEAHTAPPAVVERLTEQEVQGVIAQWNKEAGERDAAGAQPSLAAVAATLDISEAEASRLLQAVRQARQGKPAARRKRLVGRAAAAMGALVIGGCLFNSSLADTNRQEGTFVVDSVQVRPAVPSDNVLAYPLDKQVVRMDVRLTYNPPSLWRFLAGPDWHPAQLPSYLTTNAGQRIDTFPVPGGSGAGITRGWLRHTGPRQYTEGFAFPTSALRGGGATLSFGQGADDRPEQPISVPVADQSANPGS